MRKIICKIFISFFIMTLQGYAQVGKARLTGNIKDTVTGASIKAVSIALLKAEDNKICGSSISDEAGNFFFNHIEPGKYKIGVSTVGYGNKLFPVNVEVTDTLVQYRTIFLKRESTVIRGIEVTGQKNLIETRIDRFIYHADQDVTNQSGTAADVFRKIPMLVVDPNGNVSMFGSSSIRVLINGKPSSTVAFSISDAMKIIPASEIRSVEIITSPSAKYDAEGTAGVINIITKKKNLEGLNGTANLSLGNLSSSASGSVNYRSGKLGLNGALNASFNRTILYATSERNNYVGNLMTLLQRTDSKSNTRNAGGQFGAEYDLDSSSTISTSVRLNGYLLDYNNSLLTKEIDRNMGIMGDSGRYTNGDWKNKGADWITDYIKHFKNPQQELTASVQYSTGKRNTSYLLNQAAVEKNAVYREDNYNDGNNKELTFQTDYTHPFRKGRSMEVGWKSIFRSMSSDFATQIVDVDNGHYTFDPSRSGNFRYKQDVHAIYSTYSFSIKKVYLFKVGARLEETVISGDFMPEDTSFNNTYLNLIPTISIARKLKKPGSVIKVGYSRRIQRPGLTYLNPYVNQADAKNIRYGNPELQPELTDAFELGYNTFFKKIVFGVTGYFRSTGKIIESVTVINDKGVAFTTYQNISKSSTIGANLYAVYYVMPRWSITGSFNLYHYGIQSAAVYKNNGIVYTGSVVSNLTFGKGFAASFVGLYNSSKVTLQGTTSGWGMVSMGLTKEVLHKKGKIGITSNNPFWAEVKINQRLQGPDFNQYVKSGLDFRSVNLTFSYQFGKIKKTTRPKKQVIQNNDLKEESNQLGNGIK
ncbi:MAG: TonB-dependent receptor [Chitinophaga sp.]|uniref:TonB-dependent receptor domain-containing protein n=1 Tax=Chitinophaga sp. TaxID=1869181 RepID=UPI001B06CE4B|nr:TonB-dependent receptor [Chitinophaga sp.]MBO9729514.1 TonB-dependent receptor [Chitinophaga sp.]